jgi:DNA-binding GntR family transcriptional regulator
MAGPGSTVDELAAKIANSIITGEYAIGTWLRQEKLADTFSVSRQPIREALRRVQADGMVEIFPHRGALVRGPSPREIREAYLVRAELEGFAAELAASRMRESQLQELRRAEEGFRKAVRRVAGDGAPAGGGDAGWARANDLFHETVLEGAAVRALGETIRGLHHRVVPRNLTWMAIRTKARLEDNVREHAAIRAALEAGNAAAARRAMTEHILHSGELIAEFFEERQRAVLPDSEEERSGGSA